MVHSVIPKHSCFLDGCSRKVADTRQIMKWKPNEVLSCALCGNCNDTHEHLCFLCHYSKTVEEITRYDECKIL